MTLPRFIVVFAALTTLAVLAACSSSKTASESAAPASIAVAAAAASHEGPRQQDAAPAAKTQVVSLPAPSAAAAPAKPKLPVGAESPKKLVGLERATLEDLLGAPWMVRREGSSELWQYRAGNCVLDIFMYAKADGVYRVTHTDLRGRRDNRAAPAGCYAEIVNGSDSPQQTAEY